jgi:hypothetical protein
MSRSLFDKPPYFDWRIDRWKVGLIVLLFLALLLATLVDPQRDRSPGWTAAGPLMPDEGGAVVTEAAEEPPAQESDPTAALFDHADDLPLTLASIGPNSVAPPEAVAVLSGTARPGNRVEVRAQHIPAPAAGDGSFGDGTEMLLGVATADTRGLWTLALEESLAAGQQALSLRELDDQGDIVSVASPVVITVLAAGEEGPVSLATPSIRFPAAAARLRGGRITFVGSGLPGMRVRLYLNNRQIAEGAADMREEWRITPEAEIPPGVYVARAAALDPQGEIVAESPPVAFVVLEAVEGAIPKLPDADPTIPLALTGAAMWGRNGLLVLTGRATPHSTVSAWRDEAALRYVNARLDGGWQMWLISAAPSHSTYATEPELTLRTNLGESIRRQESALGATAAAPYQPILLSPKEGEVLANGQPVLHGLAHPASGVNVKVNSLTVARLVADARGQWAYQPPEPLPAGEVAIAACAETAAQGDAESPPIYVTAPPQS